jgi:hypothetical protein
MYDGFPLRRADANTRGDDYQYVIQSLDAAIRHTFGLPTGVSMTPAFSIDEDGHVEILKTLTIGSDVQIDEIIDSIPTSAVAGEDEQLATVNALRGFIGDAVEVYLLSLDTFVLKAGDTMTGALTANGGITAATDLDITNALFVNDPRLDSGVALRSDGAALVQYDGGVLVGDASKTLRMTGSATRPTYKGSNLALVSDFVDMGGITLDYVPKIGGDFSGLVGFEAGLRIASANQIVMDYNAGADDFVLAEVGTDALGDVVFDSGAGTHRFTGDLRIDEALQLDTGSGFVDILTYTAVQVQLGNAGADLAFLGADSRPLYNGADLALLTDLSGIYIAGAGISLTPSGGSTEIAIETNGINISHMPIGDYGEYLRISSIGILEWDSLDIVSGTGMSVTEDPVTKQITVAIENLGVDTAQLAADAVDGTKIADDAIGLEHIDASGNTDPAETYSLTVTGSTLAWAEGSGGGGSGGLLSTKEFDSYQISIGGGGAEKTVEYSNGPYIIYSISCVSGSAWGATYKISIDNEPDVLTGGFNDADTEIRSEEDIPIFAAETISVYIKSGSGAAFSQTMTLHVARLGSP